MLCLSLKYIRTDTQLDLSHLAHSLIHMHKHLNIPISFAAVYFSHAPTQIDSHTHTRWSIPGILFNIWWIGFCLLLHHLGCPLLDPGVSWWITRGLGWMVPPSPYRTLYCHFILSAPLICHSHRPFVTALWLLCALHMHVSAYAHTSDSLTPARSSSWAATPTSTQGRTCLLL